MVARKRYVIEVVTPRIGPRLAPSLMARPVLYGLRRCSISSVGARALMAGEYRSLIAANPSASRSGRRAGHGSWTASHEV